MKEIQSKLGLFDTDMGVNDLCKLLCASYATKSPENFGSESGSQWAVRYAVRLDLDKAREERIRATILGDLSKAANAPVELAGRISLGLLARFAMLRGIKFIQERAIASLPSLYEQALGELLAAQSSAAGSKKPPPLREQHWQDEVLRVIRKLGHDPMKLKKEPKGKPGVRNEVWTELIKQKSPMSKKSFEKAWQALRGLGLTAVIDL